MNDPRHPGWKLSRNCIHDAYMAKRSGIMKRPDMARELTAACLSALRRTHLAPHVETQMIAGRYLELQRRGLWNYMGRQINPVKLLPKQELLDFLEENGAHDRGLAHIRDRYDHEFGIDLIWRFPLSEGTHAGGTIVPVREGFLWLPYDEIDAEDYEIFKLEHASMMQPDTCAFLHDDLRDYTDSLCEALCDMSSVLRCRTIE